MVNFKYIEIVLILLKCNEVGTQLEQQNQKNLGSTSVVQVNLMEIMWTFCKIRITPNTPHVCQDGRGEST